MSDRKLIFGSSSIWLQACLALGRAHPVDEWLQAALALSIEKFPRGRLPVARHAGGAPQSP